MTKRTELEAKLETARAELKEAKQGATALRLDKSTSPEKRERRVVYQEKIRRIRARIAGLEAALAQESG